MPAWNRTEGRPLRVVHLPGDIGGHPQTLARAERELGVDSRSLVFEPSPFDYRADELLLPPAPSLAQRARFEMHRLHLVRRLAREADVVHFNFGQSTLPRPIVIGSPSVAGFPRAVQHAYRAWSGLLGMRDLGYLRRSGVAVFVTFQGDDVRQADICRRDDDFGPASDQPADRVSDAMDAARRTVVGRFDRWANGMWYLNPDLSRFLPARAEFLPYANVDPRVIRPRARVAGDVVRIAHAPTSRMVKGTHAVIAALDALRAEGIAFELDVIEGVTNTKALTRLQEADLVVDQLRLGWYGGLAVECMAMGLPVVAHLDDRWDRVLPAAFRSDLPIIRADPTTIGGVLRELLTARRSELPRIGSRGRAFVERWHDPRHLARRTIDAYSSALERDLASPGSGTVTRSAR